MQLNHIELGDARQLAASIPDESIDFIFTDPPYDKEHLYLYAWLSETAARVLKPGCLCMTYCGSVYLDKIYQMMGKHLTFFYEFYSVQPGAAPIMWARRVQQNIKAIVAFSKGKATLPDAVVNDFYTSPRGDKRFHKWGQSERVASYYISFYSKPGDVLYEPFAGGGTVPYVCLQKERNFYASEVDEEQCFIARKRLELIQKPFANMAEIEQIPLTF